MIVSLTTEDLKTLVRGTSPDYPLLDHPLVAKRGSFGPSDQWYWNRALDELSNQELFDLYVLCRDCWNKYKC